MERRDSGLTHQDVLEILRLIDASSYQELVLEVGDTRLVVRKFGAQPVGGQAAGAQTARGEAAAAPVWRNDALGRAPAQGTGTTPALAPAGSVSAPLPAGAVAVRAPMIGRFYRGPEPGAPPFVEVGSRVEPDDTVGLIEVMKLFNQITAGVRGQVVAICAEDGQMVEFGQELMWIAPDA